MGIKKFTRKVKQLCNIDKVYIQLAELEASNTELDKELAFLKKECKAKDMQLHELQKECQSMNEVISKLQKNKGVAEKIALKVEKIEEQIKVLNKSEKRNLNNHEKYTVAITELRRQNKRMATAVKEYIEDKEYEYNCSLPTELYRQEICDWYKRRSGKDLNLDNPQTLTDKINWIKLYDSPEKKTVLTDKLRVREWIKEKIGEQYLVPLIGVWDNFDDIRIEELPNKFAMKCNHGSGMIIVVDNKDNFDASMARRKMSRWMKTNYAYTEGLEMHYKNIKPCIMVEEFLESAGELLDYKILCFSGKAKYIWVDYDIFGNHTRDIFDLDWNLQPFSFKYPSSNEPCEKPKNLSEMIRIAEILSEGFSFVRVDLYDINDRVYFGEITFTCENGIGWFEPDEYDKILGDEVIL